MSRAPRLLLTVVAVLAFTVSLSHAKDITLPPSGDNQVASVTQHIGLVRVTIDYSSPNVHAPDGHDRRGHIWGDLVPYGMADLGYNNCKSCPWRGGANENTVFTVSHAVKIEGQPLPAGAYGLFFIPGKEEWTVIFSKNHLSWGAYWYDPAEDQLRVKVKPTPGAYHEWLSYEFTDRETDHATVALQWEELQVPITIKVDDITGVYVENLKQEFRNAQSFKWQNFRDAADYTLRSKSHLDQGLVWADLAVNDPANGAANFQTLTTLANLQRANGRNQDAAKTLDRALALQTASPVEIHGVARGMQLAGDAQGARRIYLLNAKRFPDQWPVNVGMARASAISGDNKAAAAYARKALAQAPDDGNKRNLENMIKQFEAPPAK